ncbi:uncharacterized protein N0V89_002838 [Didymosphaeria variabile]|uniref:Mid2 domain-containing protein n=1 Tax=Didymosphaeria variabile TaxID=1932322 RepID=A0A9W8XU89_9PLEO|nr:uncharacterized protein N0V89_002838 [Didymosphaeria variabile]KAJ4358258.1 hypothetical protein N0V89_002838 [Didymosphaeria variabile]
MVWLCWIAVLGSRGVEAQDNGGGSGALSGNANANFGGGGGRKGGQQGSDQAATNNPTGEGDDEEAADTSTSPSPPSDLAPVAASAALASADPETSVALPEANTTLVAASATPTESFEQPTSVADAFPRASIYLCNSPTSSRTVYVTSAVLPLPTSIPAEEDSSASTQATQAPSLDLAPLPASSVKPLSPGEKAGVGVGITFAVLVIAGAIAYELFRRRKMKARERRGGETDSQDPGPPRRNFALKSFFGPNNNHEKRSDPEWSIESAEEMSIVRAGSVKSVESQARPITPPLPSLPSGPRFGLAGSGTEVVKVGMTVPERKPTPKLADMALRSNPPVSPSSFPSPPRAGKTGSWPLPE